MASFVLIHGSWHGAWCWDKLAPRLRDQGHRVAAIDLPAHGQDRTSPLRVGLGSYSKRVQSAAADLAEKPILVGHSMGGLAITRAALDAPQRFAALVYLCAFVPLPGESLFQLARQDASSRIPENARYGPTGVRIQLENAREIFYNGCSDADAAWATQLLRPDPLLPLLQKLRGRTLPDLPRGYIECTQDQAISLSRQRSMAGRVSFAATATLESDHSPFLSAPDELARSLDEMSQLAT